MAKPEPPGRLHSSTGSPYEESCPLLSQMTSTRVGLPDHSGAFSVTDRASISRTQ